MQTNLLSLSANSHVPLRRPTQGQSWDYSVSWDNYNIRLQRQYTLLSVLLWHYTVCQLKQILLLSFRIVLLFWSFLVSLCFWISFDIKVSLNVMLEDLLLERCRTLSAWSQGVTMYMRDLSKQERQRRGCEAKTSNVAVFVEICCHNFNLVAVVCFLEKPGKLSSTFLP